jgi:5-methylcytosine-specific restriction enzyme A
MSDDPEATVSRAHLLRIFAQYNGTCVRCGKRINGARDEWVVERIAPTTDDLTSFAPVHRACPGVSNNAEAGERRPSPDPDWPTKRPLPFGRKSRLKRKITGEIVSREK